MKWSRWLTINSLVLTSFKDISCALWSLNRMLRRVLQESFGMFILHEHSPECLFLFEKHKVVINSYTISFSGKILFIIEIVLWFTTYSEIPIMVFLEKRKIEHVPVTLNTLSEASWCPSAVGKRKKTCSSYFVIYFIASLNIPLARDAE